MCVVCVFGGVKSERVVSDEVREVCAFVGLGGVCFGLQSPLKRLPAKPQMFKAVFLRAEPVSGARQEHRAKNMPV